MLWWLRISAMGKCVMGGIANRMSSLLVASVASLTMGIAAFLRVRKLSLTLSSPVEEAEDSESHQECRIVKTHNILLILSKVEDGNLEELARDFCGTVINYPSPLPDFSNKTVYLCGNIARTAGLELESAEQVSIIRELSYGYGYEGNPSGHLVDLGRVPILVHNVGVYYRRFFDPDLKCFDQIQSEHAFQTLTESNKPGTAHRTGIYLTPVEQHGEDIHFRLLRCSSNFAGPTVNFGTIDNRIVEDLNREAAGIFLNGAPLNHVLAQIYHNAPATADQKQTKAKIKAHSDKTKDMPGSGIMAFCTFYDQLERLEPMARDSFDYGHKNMSGLTKLHFRLKDCAATRDCSLTRQFSVTLYPNSVFFMPLSTNRLYTHEIRPGALDAHLSPTRMGYVVRCSATEAVHKDGQSFLKMPGGKLSELEPPTKEGMQHLRALYAEENSTDAVIDYGKHGPINFSMNTGDYTRPVLHNAADRFRVLTVHTEENLFEELFSSVQFENTGKGREGAVLVKPDGRRGTPIVRTTTKYGAPAQCFQSAHEHLAQQIQKLACLPVGFNNALVENYSNAYTKMGFHSDQELDLQDGTAIAIFSCYRHPEASPPRKLVVEPKEPGSHTFEIPLTHNSLVIFSVETNRQFRHKIVLDTGGRVLPENQWLGFTFRTSRTFVQYCAGQVSFEDSTPLTLADNNQCREFYKLRGCESQGRAFVYPSLTYTISESDMMQPKPVDQA